MRKKVNFNKVNEVTLLMVEKLKTLEELQNQLNTDIDMINEVYEGKDSYILINKYKENAKNIDALKNTLDAYIKYFKWLIESYGEVLNKTVARYESIIQTVKQFNENPVTSDISKTILSGIYKDNNMSSEKE